MYKKAVSILVALILVFTLVSCASSTTTAATTAATTKAAGSTTAAATTAAATTGAMTSAANTTKFKIGTFQPLSGGNSAYGIEARNAIQLGIDYINSQGGFNGQQIELVSYDTTGSAEEAVKVATKLINVDKVDACIGSLLSGEVLAAAGYMNDAKIITFGLGTSPTWMTKDWPFVFRATMNNAFAMPITADLVKKVGNKSIAIFKGQDDSSLATAKTFIEECKSRGIQVLADESYDAGDTDFSAQIAKINASKAEAVFISVIGEAGPVIVKQLRQYGYNGLIYDKESFMVSQIAIAGEKAANYILFANPYVTYASPDKCDIPNVKSFLERYLAKYGKNVATDSAYRGWDTMMVMWEATKIAKSNKSDDLRKAVHTIKGLPGLGGTLDFTAGNREGYKTFNAFVLVNGENVLFDKWLTGGGFEAYKKATGRSY